MILKRLCSNPKWHLTPKRTSLSKSLMKTKTKISTKKSLGKTSCLLTLTPTSHLSHNIQKIWFPPDLISVHQIPKWTLLIRMMILRIRFTTTIKRLETQIIQVKPTRIHLKYKVVILQTNSLKSCINKTSLSHIIYRRVFLSGRIK